MNDDQIQPQDIDAERTVLGAMLTTAKAVDDVTAVVTRGDFYQPIHSQIFDAITALAGSGKPCDPVATAAELHNRGELSKIGGAPYLVGLYETAGIISNAGYYAAIVRDKADRRMLQEVAQRIHALADSPAAAEVLVENARAMLDKPRITRNPSKSVADLMPGVVDLVDKGGTKGLRTPWPDLDRLLHGLKPGRLYVVGARPGVGKSVMGQALATYWSEHHARAVFFASLEMPDDELGLRILASRAGVDLGRLSEGTIDEREWERLGRAAQWSSDARIVVDDSPTQTVGSIRSSSRDVARKQPLGLVVVDYLGLVTPRDPKLPRQEQVAEVSRALKVLAKELDVPVVALAQLNRALAGRSDKTPTLTDLRESGAIEADADGVLLLDRPDESEHELTVHVAKNRGGPKGKASLYFQGHLARIVSPERNR